MQAVLVVHYDEVGLKKGNRRFFMDRLVESMKRVVKTVGRAEIRRLRGRIRIRAHAEDEAWPADLPERIVAIPGVRYLIEGVAVEPTPEAILKAAHAVLPDGPVASFGVRARRSIKSFPLTSPELERMIGESVGEAKRWPVDLKKPELWIRIEVLGDEAMVCARRLEGPGGLPVGSSGKGVALLSGGIDSPVAAHMMMTRGLRLRLLHFHSAPFTSQASQEKVRDLAALLQRLDPTIRLAMVPLANPIQRAIVASTPERYRVILARRFMARLAIREAQDMGASCLVTGEALGQVASQTIPNMTTVEALSPYPILRPLVGMGKTDIIQRAERIGAYEISIRPHEDCCSYLMPENPVTKTTPDELDHIEKSLDVEALVEEAWAQRVVESHFEEPLDTPTGGCPIS